VNFCFISDKKQDNRKEDIPSVSQKSVEEARANQEFTVENGRQFNSEHAVRRS
jgi:hypothetical protein